MPIMKHCPKILVTGGSGMVGQHLQLVLSDAVFPTKQELNLCDIFSIENYFDKNKPEIIVHAAAKVGGIVDNMTSPYDFFEQNVLINTNIIKTAIKYRIPRLLAISSTCAYPDTVDVYPITENDLHSGPPSKTNFAYSYAKRTMCVQIDSANQQLGTKYNYIFPCNLYSDTDSLHNPVKMHFITALLYKIANAEISGQSFIEVFGTGSPMRQFMYAGDLAKIIDIMIQQNINKSFNVAPDNSNLSIDCMTKQILSILDKSHWEIKYNTEKPDGQYRKDVSNKLMKDSIGNFQFSSFQDNIQRIYSNYVQQILAKNKKTTNT